MNFNPTPKEVLASLNTTQKLNKQEIIASPNVKYMSEFMDDLPDYTCYLNKVLCGAGGTHLALTSKSKYIILVPYLALLDSKSLQTLEDGSPKYKDVFLVREGVTPAQIQEALDKGVTKILSTYHGLSKLNKVLSYKDKQSFKLLVDEAHILIAYDDKDFNHDVVQEIYNNYEDYKATCFMTATPNADDCLPDCIYKHPYVTIVWSDVEQVEMVTQRVDNKKIPEYLLQIVFDHNSNKRAGRPYFFYNSVQAITKICKTLLTAQLVKATEICIVAADKNDGYFKKYGHKDLAISTITELNQKVVDDKVKLVFLTAKAFEGADIYDKDAVTYIVSDGNKVHTRLEIHTQIPQIVNRTRDSQYRLTANLIYTNSLTYDCRSKAEIKEFVKEQLIANEDIVTTYAETSPRVKEALDASPVVLTCEFLTTGKHNEITLNPNALKRSLNYWEALNSTYSAYSDNKNHITKAQSRATFLSIVEHNEENNVEYFKLPEGKDKALIGKVPNFRQLCKDYIEDLTSDKDVTFYEEYNEIFYQLRQVYKTPDSIVSVIGSAGGQQKNLKTLLDTTYKFKQSEDGLKKYLDLKPGNFYTKSELKDKIAEYYKQCGIKKAAKATLVEQLFKVRATTKRINNKTEHIYIVIGN